MAYGAYSGVDTLAQTSKTASEVARKEKQLELAASTQKKKMATKFEADIKEAQERAKKKSKKNSGLFKALNFAGMFLGPAGQALTGALSGGLQAKQSRDAMKELMKGPQFEKYKGTFLGDIAEQQMQTAKDAQQSAGASLLGGLVGGLGGFLGGKALGGKGMKTGFFKGVGQGAGPAGAMPFVKGSGPLAALQGPMTQATPFKSFFGNVGQIINPTKVATTAESIQRDSTIAKIMDALQSGQKIANLSSGNVDLIKALESLQKDENEKEI
tara:strand:- start:15730 stop:16539 length:810 start_codon:yes stop_codon:yes gene_type:complete